VGGDVNLFSHYENQCGGSLKTKGNWVPVAHSYKSSQSGGSLRPNWAKSETLSQNIQQTKRAGKVTQVVTCLTNPSSDMNWLTPVLQK
jgi:hypothetical protein